MKKGSVNQIYKKRNIKISMHIKLYIISNMMSDRIILKYFKFYFDYKGSSQNSETFKTDLKSRGTTF